MVALRSLLDDARSIGLREKLYVPVAEAKLQCDEDSDEQAETEDAAPYAGVVPGVKRATPLQS